MNDLVDRLVPSCGLNPPDLRGLSVERFRQWSGRKTAESTNYFWIVDCQRNIPTPDINRQICDNGVYQIRTNSTNKFLQLLTTSLNNNNNNNNSEVVVS